MNFANRVPLTGTIDGVNTTFTLPLTPTSGATLDIVAFTPQVGLVQKGSITESWHYTRSDLEITLGLAPQTEDERPRASYLIDEAVVGTTTLTGGVQAGAFYQRMRNVAARQLAYYGRTLTLTRRTAEPTYNTTTGQVSVSTESLSFRGAVFSIDDRNADGSTVLATDKRVLAVLDSAPQVGNSIAGITAVDHTVMNVRPLQPGDVCVMYEMQVRA